MQFGTAFFWYQILVTNTTCSVFEAVYGTSFLVRFSAPIYGMCVMDIIGQIMSVTAGSEALYR